MAPLDQKGMQKGVHYDLRIYKIHLNDKNARKKQRNIFYLFYVITIVLGHI